ncbi:MAG: MBL fold metallo-hydrolase [Candidatus Limnocylindria bacterium]
MASMGSCARSRRRRSRSRAREGMSSARWSSCGRATWPTSRCRSRSGAPADPSRAPAPETIRYGGNTACVQVEGDNGEVLVLDAGTGIRRAGIAMAGDGRPVHLLLTHLHMDHIQGLGFFRPLFEPGREVHIWARPHDPGPDGPD